MFRLQRARAERGFTGMKSSQNPRNAPRACFSQLRLHGAFDAKRETACGCTAHLKILRVPAGEEFFDNRLEFAVRNEFLREQAPSARVGFDGAWAPAELFGKSGVLRVTRASILVNIDGTRLRQRLNSRKAIVGEEDPPVFSSLKGAKAVTAGSVVRGDLRVGRKSVDRSA